MLVKYADYSLQKIFTMGAVNKIRHQSGGGGVFQKIILNNKPYFVKVMTKGEGGGSKSQKN